MRSCYRNPTAPPHARAPEPKGSRPRWPVSGRFRPEADTTDNAESLVDDQLATERLALPEPIQRCTELFVQGVPVPVRRPCEGVSSVRNATDSHVTTHYAQPCDGMFCR